MRVVLFWGAAVTVLLAVFSCGSKLNRPQEIPFEGTIGETTFVQLNPPWDADHNYNFNRPGKIIFGYDTYLYVADTDNDRIVRLDAAGTVHATYAVPHPVGITQDELLRLLVVTGTSREIYKIDVGPNGQGQAILCYDGNDSLEAVLGVDSTAVFVDISDAPGYDKRYYVAAASPLIDASGMILMFSNTVPLQQDSDRPLPRKFLVQGDTARNPVVEYGTGLGYVDHPTGVTAFRRNNRDYLLITQDSSSFRVQLLVWNSNSYYRIGWFSTALMPGADNDLYTVGFFSKPAAATVDSSGNIYVVDAGTGVATAAYKFNPTGDLKNAFGPPGSETGQMLSPRGVTYDNLAERRTLFISDTGNNRILRFKLSIDLER